jgi:hypothetical protein
MALRKARLKLLDSEKPQGGRFSMEEMTELKWISVQRGQRAFPI